MKDGICTKCGSSEVYTRRDGYFGLDIPVSLISPTFIEMFVCAKCGYLEFYVQNESKLKQIPESFKKVG